MVIKKLYEFFRDKTLFNREKKLHSIDEERLFFSGLPKAGDRMEKAFLKYRCMSWYNYPFFTRILFNLGAALILPFAYIYYISRPADKKNTAEKYDAVIRRNNSIAYDDIIPEILTDGKKVKEIARYDFKEGILDEKAREIYAGITRKYRGHFYFRLLVLLKLAEYRGWITKYSPDAILVYAFERDVALPLKTELCEYYDVEHIGFMHGDLIYSVDKAYIDLTKYYIWDMHYRDVLMEAGAESEQFVLYEPKIFRKEISGKVPGYEITYYFSAESELLLRNVYKNLKLLETGGYKCKIRPHPRYSDLKLVSSIFKNIHIEDTKKVSIDESLADTVSAAGLKSTVLLQAYYAGKNIVIDDISDPDFLEFLKKGRFILLEKEHMWLSDIMKEV